MAGYRLGVDVGVSSLSILVGCFLELTEIRVPLPTFVSSLPVGRLSAQRFRQRFMTKASELKMVSPRHGKYLKANMAGMGILNLSITVPRRQPMPFWRGKARIPPSLSPQAIKMFSR